MKFIFRSSFNHSFLTNICYSKEGFSVKSLLIFLFHISAGGVTASGSPFIILTSFFIKDAPGNSLYMQSISGRFLLKQTKIPGRNLLYGSCQGFVISQYYIQRRWKVLTNCFNTLAWVLSSWLVAALSSAVEELVCTTLVI